ncbi:hypothetical protein GCM10011494_08970 [Novosphingobium endophyticum]|uniref:DUF4145 domain-containing protein n=1 Tax=Novosphingobium endophyticum TaxID=1955250 RepID=A0A916X3F9_9SPHN|nr:DUF4145 domain-containing protein [Novosphingobium endophyticum]GGB92791.1 hypothetical protein GCM10011494_08970 [Novosphingobium endophyticum]
MAVQFRSDCPHCLTRNAGFQVVFQWNLSDKSEQAYLLSVCGICNKGVIVHATKRGGGSFPDAVKHTFDFPKYPYEMFGISPAPNTSIPHDLPPNVQHFYQQGLENLASARWDAAGAMFRKTLDVATKILGPSDKSLSLFKRIEKLVSDGHLTEAMGAWSHEIRLDGNDAVHDEAPETETDVTILQKFSEAFLTYSFSLPRMVARNRAKREAKDMTGCAEEAAA